MLASMTVALPWAVHIHDGILRPTWLGFGFALACLLAFLAALRIRDEEIPRVALLTAAFFVASLLHLPLGPMSVHLLFNGLVGVVLGRRAPLAILVGVGLQAVFGHGGFTTIGVNACVQMLPALLAAGLFAALSRLTWVRRGDGAALWGAGCLVGVVSVFAALVLEAAVLLLGGAEDWGQIVRLVFLAHLPVVAVEGVVLGFTVRFLARVKPEMMGLARTADEPRPVANTPPALLPVALALLLSAGPAQAHRLDAECHVLSGHRVRIECWFDLGGKPEGAAVRVYRPGERLLAEGRLDERGQFTFAYEEAEPLQVIVSAGAGHRKEFTIPREKLELPSTSFAPPPTAAEAEVRDSFPAADPYAAWRERIKDVLLGVSFLLALGAFVLSWRNGRRLRSLLGREGQSDTNSRKE